MAKLHDIEVDDYLAESVEVDELDLDDELRKIPSRIAYWNAKHAAALKAALVTKRIAKKTRARMTIEAKHSIENRGEKATVQAIDAWVEDELEVETTEIDSIEAEVERVYVRGMCDAVMAKKDVLQTISAKLRVELGHDLAVRAKHRDAREQDEGFGTD